MSDTLPNEATLRDEICQVGRRLWEKDFVAANDGNISVRLDEQRILCTPTGISKGFMTPDDLIVVDPAGQRIEGHRESTSEIRMHIALYQWDESLRAVVHAHPPLATAFAIVGEPLPTGVLPEVETLLGPVPIAPYATPGTPQVPENILACLRPGMNTALMSHHGAVSFDRSLELAFFHLETLENYCRVILACRQLGKVPTLSDEQLGDILAAKKAMGLPDPRHDG